jgi:glycosyltransferase involved in cell wall biosynthesis
MSDILSIVIPVYNEEDNLKILYQELLDYINNYNKSSEIIFVNDCSKDKTLSRLKEIKLEQDKDKNSEVQIKIINFSANFGQTAAMQAGFDYAKGEIIVSMDGDLQNDPADIPKLIKKLNEGYDLVCGWRKDRKDKAVTRVFPSKVANWIIGKITGVPIHDNGCSLKAYRRNIIKSIRLYSDMHRFIPAMASTVDAKIAEVVVNHRHRKFGTTKYGLSRIWKVLSDIITIKMIIHFHSQPLLWFSLLSFIFAFFGIGFGIMSLITYAQGVRSIVYPTASFLFLSLFGSYISLGILAESFTRQEKK